MPIQYHLQIVKMFHFYGHRFGSTLRASKGFAAGTPSESFPWTPLWTLRRAPGPSAHMGAFCVTTSLVPFILHVFVPLRLNVLPLPPTDAVTASVPQCIVCYTCLVTQWGPPLLCFLIWCRLVDPNEGGELSSFARNVNAVCPKMWHVFCPYGWMCRTPSPFTDL